MHDHLKAAESRSKEKIEWLLELEKSPATLNTHYYLDYKNKFLSYFRSCRHSPKLAEEVSGAFRPAINRVSDRPDPVHEAISALSRLGIYARHEDFHKLLPSDPMEAALGIMASVRAYFQGTNCKPLNENMV